MFVVDCSRRKGSVPCLSISPNPFAVPSERTPAGGNRRYAIWNVMETLRFAIARFVIQDELSWLLLLLIVVTDRRASMYSGTNSYFEGFFYIKPISLVQ